MIEYVNAISDAANTATTITTIQIAPAIDAAFEAGLSALLEYLSAHVLTCLIPAFFIAGAISALLQKETVLRYFGAGAPAWLSYAVAATSGTILAVCSCTILPMFAGIEKKGAGIGPATAFLFSGPAINIMAIILTARVLGPELGLARAVAAIGSSVIIGLLMAAIFCRGGAEKSARQKSACQASDSGTASGAVSGSTSETDATAGLKAEPVGDSGSLKYLNGAFISVLVAILLFATTGIIDPLSKALIVAALICLAAFMMIRFYGADEREAFLSESWFLAKRIFPLLIIGTFITGILGYFLPVELVRGLFGTNSPLSCFIASVIGALLYMPTLLEVPIVGSLFGYSSGITAPGPALSLLLAGPSLSLPSMMVITRVIGFRKGGVYIVLVVLMSTIAGVIYGAIA